MLPKEQKIGSKVRRFSFILVGLPADQNMSSFLTRGHGNHVVSSLSRSKLKSKMALGKDRSEKGLSTGETEILE